MMGLVPNAGGAAPAAVAATTSLRERGQSGRPIYTFCVGSVTALSDMIKKLPYCQGSTTGLKRSRTALLPDGRNLPLELQMEGTNLTEAEHAVYEKALSAPAGYKNSPRNAVLEYVQS